MGITHQMSKLDIFALQFSPAIFYEQGQKPNYHAHHITNISPPMYIVLKCKPNRTSLHSTYYIEPQVHVTRFWNIGAHYV